MEETRSLRDKTARGFLWGGINNGTVQVLGALFGIVMLRLLTPAHGLFQSGRHHSGERFHGRPV